MKSLSGPAVLVGCSLPMVACAMTVASSFMGSHKAHQFRSYNGPLSTLNPVSVNVLRQDYERQPSAVAQTYPATNAIASASSNEAVSRCRSFNVSDNTYQPLTGGPRHACTGSISPAKQVAQVLQSSRVGNSDDRERRCAAKYNSYRVSDNTYQPYGTARRACTI
ncbi:BA14K family protein [Agrobacterium rubi]|nr:BA14K family protein [Agrobacterium rubi]NTF23087.1 BA14K family protein [Agrobacterium rubi]NTF30018.1 BA14K family protein [Agrobacterium rubi]